MEESTIAHGNYCLDGSGFRYVSSSAMCLLCVIQNWLFGLPRLSFLTCKMGSEKQYHGSWRGIREIVCGRPQRGKVACWLARLLAWKSLRVSTYGQGRHWCNLAFLHCWKDLVYTGPMNLISLLTCFFSFLGCSSPCWLKVMLLRVSSPSMKYRWRNMYHVQSILQIRT